MKQILITIAAVVLMGCGPSADIHQAAEAGNIKAVKQLVAAGVDVNAQDEDRWTPLYTAAREGHKEVVELLIAKGADVNLKNGLGQTPLHTAARFFHKDIVELLITKGADVNAKEYGDETPFDYAKMYNAPETEIVDLLRKHGGKTGR